MRVAKIVTAWLACSVVLLFTLTTAGANTNVSDEKAQDTETARAVELLALGDSLAAYAIEMNDPIMMIQAARIKGSVSVQEGAHEAEQIVHEQVENGDKDATGHDLSPTALLDRAQALASGNRSLVAMVREARDEINAATRGRVGGPVVHVDRVEARSTDVYRVSFKAQERAVVSIAGDGDTDLDLFIYDENNNRICSSISMNDRETCQWTPRWEGEFQIKITNLGHVWNQYVLTTN